MGVAAGGVGSPECSVAAVSRKKSGEASAETQIFSCENLARKRFGRSRTWGQVPPSPSGPTRGSDSFWKKCIWGTRCTKRNK